MRRSTSPESTKDQIIAWMDDVLIDINDGKRIKLEKLIKMPPWRAAMLATVAVHAGAFPPHLEKALRAEAAKVGGLGTLTKEAILSRIEE